jgi:hypothetical protein
MAINQGSSPRQTTINLGSSFSGTGDVNAWIVTGSGMFDKNFTFNGEKGPGDYAGPDPHDANAKPYYATLTSGQSLTITLPAYSLTGIAVH